MSLSLACLDLTQIFCGVDDFYREFEQYCERDMARLPCDGQPKRYQSRLSISEVMTIVIAFHGSGYRTFKDFYKGKVLPDWREALPNWVSYGRFVELMPWSFMGLVALTPGNTDDRKPVPELTKDLVGKLFGDCGYISQALFESLFERGLELITKRRKNMNNVLMPLLDKILLRKRPIIETVNDQLKNICQIEHSRHRSPFNFLVNLVSGLIAYAYHPNKPSLGIPNHELKALPQAAF